VFDLSALPLEENALATHAFKSINPAVIVEGEILAVCTVRPLHSMPRGSPTFTEGLTGHERSPGFLMASLPSARPLFHDCLHDRVLKLRPHLPNGGLDHHHGHQILLRVHPEVSAIGAAPAEATV
jgi:hypothetical protein